MTPARRVRAWGSQCGGMMRRLLALVGLGLLAPLADGAELRFPEDFSPAGDDEVPELRVQMTIAEDGSVQAASVLASARPDDNEAVLAALRQWRFVPAYRDQQPMRREDIVGFTFAPAVVLAEPPVYRRVPGTERWRSLAEARAAPRRSTASGGQAFIEEPAQAPTPLPGEFWVSVGTKEGRPLDAHDARDPAARVRVLADAQGRVAAAQVREAAAPELVEPALRAVLGEDVQLEPLRREGRAQAAVFELPARFYAPPWFDYRRVRLPAYPPEAMRAGLAGVVKFALLVDATGEVRDIEVLEAPEPILEKAVMDAFMKMPFHPALRLGQPVAARIVMKYAFRPEGGVASATRRGARPTSADLPEIFRYDVPPARKLTPPPVYPYALARAGTAGSATVDFIIDPDGQVSEVMVRDASDPAFGRALQAAAEAWTFQPALKDGRPSWSLFRYKQVFRLSDAELMPAAARRLLRELDGPQAAIIEAAELDAKLVRRVSAVPVYPRESRQAGTGGAVELAFIVDRDGQVLLPQLISAPDEALGWAALNAAARWRFDPPRRDGKAVDARARAVLRFTADAPAP